MSKALIGSIAAIAMLAACGETSGAANEECVGFLYGKVDEIAINLNATFRESAYHMAVGEKAQIGAAFYAGGTLSGDWGATFESSDPSVARVGFDGTAKVVYAVRAGSATIRARGCRLSDAVQVEVSQP